MGIRTAEEIHAEKYALKAARGDLEPVYEKGGREKAAYKNAVDAAMA